jgi:hypothetical protein
MKKTENKKGRIQPAWTLPVSVAMASLCGTLLLATSSW